ncbi:hypothetical protein [Sandaracinus amylolyticus]|uniref:Tryptophan synthase alpha chain n=1 Tax=Sandaracinus amylolyticus TaxID=927083 RepID=A0A0F6VZQ3_9BACT|nr:hypothetical protein [Sandaracinus amylolyticus]AKF03755.1 hypothetical protein DB32_000904 [Sandaracinus amylolyticus]
MSRFGSITLVACALVGSGLVAGCTIALDPGRHQGAVDDDDGGSQSDGGGSDGGGHDDAQVDGDGGGGCAGGGVCEPAAPLGWNGPIVLVSGAGDVDPPACPASAPSTAFTGKSEPSASPATCGCECTPPSAAAMSCGVGTITTTGNAMCITIPTNHATISDGECRSIPALPSGGRWSVTSPAFSSSMGCTPAPSVDVPPITWEASHRGCGFGSPVSCGDARACAPERAEGERLCVWAEGEAACPAAFSEQVITADGADDERGCSECTCGSITGSCGGHVDIISECPAGPTTIAYARIGVASCTPASAIGGTRALASFTPTGSCPPSATTPTGTATPTGVRTVCCVPE